MRLMQILMCLVAVWWMGAGEAWADARARLNDREGQVRIVFAFDQASAPAYTLRQVDDRTLEISIKDGGKLTTFTPDPKFPEIADIRAVSDGDMPLKIWVTLAGGKYVRDVSIGARVIVDITQDAALRAKAAAIVKPSSAPVAASAPVVIATVPKAVPAPLKPQISEPTNTPTKPQQAVGDVPVITMSAASGFGVASFIHAGKLWIVIDQPDFLITPQLAGKDLSGFKPFVHTALDDATLYTLELPKRYQVMRGEGGDLYWRVVLGPPKPDVPATAAKRIEEKGGRGLFWGFRGATKIITVKDPETDEDIRVVTVNKSDQYAGALAQFAELYQPLSGIGLAVVARVDDLDVSTRDDGVVVTRPGGLSITSAASAESMRPQESLLPNPPVRPGEDGATPVIEVPRGQANHSDVPVKVDDPVPGISGSAGTPLFRFDRWALGGADALLDNESALIADLAEKKPDERASGLMSIGKMYLSNGRGSEALGYFKLATEASPPLAETPEFIGLRGAAYAMNEQYDLAYDDLGNAVLDSYPDIGAWRADALAHLQDWQQASEKLGADLTWVTQYPSVIASPMMLTFAEIALRAGDNARAAKLLTNFVPDNGVTKASQQSARDYLLGEADRQMGKKDDARKLWEALTKSVDDKFRARARLALTVLDYEDGKVKPKDAIDNLEALRYAWRGDEVEAAINARLGDIYLDHQQYLRGLNVLRDAAALSSGTDMGRRITATMNDSFRNIFLGPDAAKVDPLDAITVFEKFPELMPTGDEAIKLTMALVDRLMQVDLLGRAAKVLQDMIDHKLHGDAQVQAGLRLAAVYLLDRQPQQAMVTLNKTAALMASLGGEDGQSTRVRELALLQARAQFQSGQADMAMNTLAVLPDDADVLRARADIAWQTGRWAVAATALEGAVALDPLVENKPPTDAQAELVRNLAVATNLAGDRGRLAQLRNTYGQLMMQTNLAKEFDVITRERQTPTLADRDTLNHLVAEVDLFSSFLDAYRAASTVK